jgi:hypothetical protein
VYAHEFKPSDGSGRWSGIVAMRGGEPWLFGEDAVRLIGAPSAITGMEGAMIWVSGREDANGVKVNLYGVMRVAQ